MTALLTQNDLKATNVTWLPKIPSHWDISRGRHIFRIRKRIAGETGFDVLSVTQTGIKKKDITSGEGQLSQDYSKYQLVFKGDFVMNHMDLLTGWVDRSGFDGVTSPDYRVFELIDDECNSDFYALACQVGYTQKLFFAYGQGVSHLGRWRFPSDNFKNFYFPKPPKKEQENIAKFVTREVSRIDALTAKKANFIELLKERHQVFVSRVVTKGLEENVAMRDSDIQWIGRMPEHWDCCPVWTKFILGRGRVISNEEIHDNPGPYPVFSSQTKNDGEMGRINTFDFSGDYLTWTTDGANAGTVFKRAGFFNCTNVCGTLKPSTNDVSLSYVKNALNIATNWFVRHDINPKLMNDVMSSIRIPLPPQEEQLKIGKLLDQYEARTDQIIFSTQKSIQLLKERRSTLITAAVTGQIDLREDAA